MKKMYKASLFNYSIDEVDVISETDKTVTINKYGREQREMKTTNSICYFDSRIDAAKFIRDHAVMEVKKAESALERARELLDKAESLCPQ